MSARNEIEHDAEIACLLSERELAQRAEDLYRELFAGAVAVEELADGYGYRFPATAEWTDRVMAVVAAERQCCPFLTFEVVFEPYARALWLRFRGSPAVKEFVRTTFTNSSPAHPAAGGSQPAGPANVATSEAVEL